MAQQSTRPASQTYAQFLLTRKLGYPLWYPDLSENLPHAYLAEGVSIGDVGMITADGSFDFLFNICKEKDDPVNDNDVPSGFERVNVTPREIESFPNMYPSGTVISSASIQKRRITMQASSQENPYEQLAIYQGHRLIYHRVIDVGIGAGFDFSCSCEKGAILILPDGASRKDLQTVNKFRRAIEHNAAAWCEFVRNGGRTPESLYLVTGCVKTSSWGVASIFNQSSTREASLKFIPASMGEGSGSLSYLWDTYSPLDTRRGPDPPSEAQNQCVFLRGFKITFSEGFRTLWSGNPNITDESDENRYGSGPKSGFSWLWRWASQGQNRDNTQSGASASDNSGTSAENRDAPNIHVEMVSEISEVFSRCHSSISLTDTHPSGLSPI